MSANRRKNVMRNNAILNSYFSPFRMATFRYFVFSPGLISSFRPARTPSEKTKRRKNATRKDEITKRRHAIRRNNEKTPCEKTKNKSLKWRYFAWRFFVFSRCAVTLAKNVQKMKLVHNCTSFIFVHFTRFFTF